ncbi:MAG: AraC family transcriptional regulator [Nocardia sp.]|nr:AraC family transcriptional regulator [Nocardia sp.]
MDVLSDVIALMRNGRASSARVEWRAPWGQRFPAVPGSAGFQVVLRGSCWLRPDEGPAVPFTVGDVLFFPRGDGYGLSASPTGPLAEPACDPLTDPALFVTDTVGHEGPITVTLCGGYRLDPSQTHPLLHDLPALIHLPARLDGPAELRGAVDLLAAEISRPTLGSDTVVTALLDVLLLVVLRTWLEELPPAGHGWAAALTDPALGAALRAIHDDPAHPWTVATLAAEAGLSRSAFSRRFTGTTGQPPLTYLGWWRSMVAAKLLRRSDAPLSEIARRVGYSSEFAFANAFKRQH